jgi:hypothetical protein
MEQSREFVCRFARISRFVSKAMDNQNIFYLSKGSYIELLKHSNSPFCW